MMQTYLSPNCSKQTIQQQNTRTNALTRPLSATATPFQPRAAAGLQHSVVQQNIQQQKQSTSQGVIQRQQSEPDKKTTKTKRKSKRGKKPKVNASPVQASEETAAEVPLVLDEKPKPSTSAWSGPLFTDVVAGKAKVPTNVKKESAKKEPGVPLESAKERRARILYEMTHPTETLTKARTLDAFMKGTKRKSEVKKQTKDIARVSKRDKQMYANILASAPPLKTHRGRQKRKKFSVLKIKVLRDRYRRQQAEQFVKRNEACETDEALITVVGAGSSYGRHKKSKTFAEPKEKLAEQNERANDQELMLKSDRKMPQMPEVNIDDNVQAESILVEFRKQKLRTRQLLRHLDKTEQRKSLESAVAVLLEKLKTFQDRVYAREREVRKAQLKRRLVVGLREVRRDVCNGKAKLVFISSSIESSPAAGSIDEQVLTICTTCEERRVPVIVALTSKRLGKLVKKPHAAAVAVLNYHSAEDEVRHVKELWERVCEQIAEKQEQDEIDMRIELQQLNIKEES